MKTIIWDIDDVLNDLMKQWFEKKWLAENPGSLLVYKDIIENPPHEVLNMSLAEYRTSLDDFRLEFGQYFIPSVEILNWFKEYGSNYRHMALTAVPIKLAHISAAWLFNHFGNWIHSFNIVPSPRDSDPPFRYHSTKKEFLNFLGKGDLIIDDNLKNIQGAKELGLQTILYPQPWNNSQLSTKEIFSKLTEQKP